MMPAKAFDIGVQQSGEDLYITAFAEADNIHDNKVLYYECSEFHPNHNDNFIVEGDKDSFYQTLYFDSRPYWGGRWYKRIPNNVTAKVKVLAMLFYYRFLKQRCFVLKKSFKYIHWRWNLSHFWQVYRIMADLTLPIIAADQFEDRLWVTGQLHITGTDRNLTDTYYLEPSQEYLENRVIEFLQHEDSRNMDHYRYKICSDFVKWREAHVAKGNRIFYIAELDT
jgi:hypothetical protein